MINQTQNSAYNDYKLEILDEPLETIGLRWASERNGGSEIYSDEKAKRGPIVQITNYHEPSPQVIIQCSLSTAEEDHNMRGPHVHKLTRVPPQKVQDEFITVEVTQKPNKQFTAIFTGLKITKTKEEDYLSFYQQKLSQHYKNQRQLSSTEVEARVKDINSKEMCLKFEAYIQNEETEDRIYVCDPVFSRIIKHVANERKPKEKGRKTKEKANGQSKCQYPQNCSKRKRNSCSDSGAEQSDSQGKQYRRTDVQANPDLKETIQSNFKKNLRKKLLENCNDQVVLQQTSTPTIEEIQRRELTGIQGSEQEIVTNGIQLREIGDESLRLLSPSYIPSENGLFSPYPEESSIAIPDIPEESLDGPCASTYEYSDPPSVIIDDDLYRNNGYPDNEFELDSSQTHPHTETEVTVERDTPERNEEKHENISLYSILPEDVFLDVWSEVKDMPWIWEEWDNGFKQESLGLLESIKIVLWEPKILSIIVLVLFLVSLYDKRIGALGVLVLLYHSPSGMDVHLDTCHDILYNGLRLFGSFVVIAARLLILIVYKLIILVLEKVVFRMLSSEKKMKCILIFLNLLITIHYKIKGNIFDDSFLKMLTKEDERSDVWRLFKVSKLVKLIVLLRRKSHNIKLLNTYDLKILCKIILCSLLFYHFITSSLMTFFWDVIITLFTLFLFKFFVFI